MDIFRWKGRKLGFSLVELLLVIAFVLTMTVAILKNRQQKGLAPFELIKQVEEVTLLSLIEALRTNKRYKITLFFEDGILLTHIGYEEEGSLENNKNNFVKKRLQNPFYVHHCFIDENDSMRNQSKEVWFYVDKKGVFQEITLIISKSKDDIKYNYVLNPLRGKFEDIVDKVQ